MGLELEQPPSSIFDTPFDDLPNPKRVWVGQPGSHEEGLGRLALLTADVVARAAQKEIQTGRRVGMNWDMRKMYPAPMGRPACQHHIIPIVGGVATDDLYIFNPQQGSQWDGLRHFSQPLNETTGVKSDPITAGPAVDRVYYGGTTLADIMDRSKDRIGIHHWAEQGIAGRGVLIDYASWAAKNGIQYSAFDAHHVTLTAIQEIAHHHQITFEKGDILFVRIGLVKEYNEKTKEEARAVASKQSPTHAGVEGTKELLRFLWDTRISAVAGDSLSWESYPSKNPDIFMHEYLLAGWGMPIGELFDLEALAETCHELNRYTFFVTSMPLNMVGGVSSPPNAMAIF